MIVQGAFNLLFRPGLRKDFRDTYQGYDPIYPSYLKGGGMDMPELSASIITGPNRLYEKGDGEAIRFVYPKMGPKVVGVDKEFAGGFIISRKTVEDDQYNKANSASKWLAHAARLTYEYQAASLLDDAFAGAIYKGIDGLALAHTAHTLINSPTTVANAMAAPVQLSITGITAVLDLVQLMKDENGDPIRMMPDKLIIGNNATDVNTAMAIWHSQLEPFTPNNTDNVTKRRLPKLEVITQVYKQAVKPWFMVDSRWNDAHLLTRRAVDFDDDFDFRTQAALYSTTTRFLVWFVDWKGWFGVNAT